MLDTGQLMDLVEAGTNCARKGFELRTIRVASVRLAGFLQNALRRDRDFITASAIASASAR